MRRLHGHAVSIIFMSASMPSLIPVKQRRCRPHRRAHISARTMWPELGDDA